METKVIPVADRAKIYSRQTDQSSVFCKFYVGDFVNRSLAAQAEIELWSCRIQGLPQNSEGYGATPTKAIRDSVQRNLEQIIKLEQANRALNAALKLEGWDDNPLE